MLESIAFGASTDYGILPSAYGWFNVFLLMLIFPENDPGQDGVRFTGFNACLLMLVGCGIKYYTISVLRYGWPDYPGNESAGCYCCFLDMPYLV